MELKEANQNDKIIRAKKRVEELKGFYVHLTVFVLVNILISGVIIYGRMSHGESFGEALFSFGTFTTAIFWGIGLAFHALKVFNPIFGKGWEERQIQKYIEKDKEEAERFNKNR